MYTCVYRVIECSSLGGMPPARPRGGGAYNSYIVAIFYPFRQFCEIDVSLLSLQQQPHTAPNLFQRGVEYGKYDSYVMI